jgi:hypothetical protein
MFVIFLNVRNNLYQGGLIDTYYKNSIKRHNRLHISYKIKKKHGLLCKKDCGLWNRYDNSARNIYKIANNAINKKERSNYLSSKVISGTSSVCKLQCNSTSVEATKSKFTRLETGKLC